MRTPGLRHLPQPRIGGDLVDLVDRERLLAGPEVADVDQDPVAGLVVLEAADRQRRRADRLPRLGRRQLEDRVEIVGSQGRGDDAQKRLPFLCSEHRSRCHVPPIGTNIPDC